MAIVHVRVPAALRPYTGGEAVVDVDAGRDPTVTAVLDALSGAHPDFERRLRDEQGEMRPHVNVFLGDDNIRDLAGLATPLPEGCQLTVLPAISGGIVD
jgi:molybdopterin synthase sulfur carrier subunit